MPEATDSGLIPLCGKVHGVGESEPTWISSEEASPLTQLPTGTIEHAVRVGRMARRSVGHNHKADARAQASPLSARWNPALVSLTVDQATVLAGTRLGPGPESMGTAQTFFVLLA